MEKLQNKAAKLLFVIYTIWKKGLLRTSEKFILKGFQIYLKNNFTIKF